ncbi:nucleotidyltransferase family protein [Sphaerisporangium album]|uniref:nucleotidyltransferase family protein n=1 Tax=Sphaerisporangium album TaxID=509200 RepID=UPI001FE50123|nr:nucleotidyltransferase family protein [Sphaerisporangium album]
MGRYGWAGADAFAPAPDLLTRQRDLDWSWLTTQLYRHRLMGLGWQMLIGPWSDAGGKLPRGYALYETWYSATVHRNRLMREELRRVAAHLHQADVQVLLRRGPALIEHTYHDHGVRPMSDIDLLIRPGQEERFVAALGELGYRSGDLSADKRTIIARPAPDEVLPRLLKPTGDPLLRVLIIDASTVVSAAAPQLDTEAVFMAARATPSLAAAMMTPHHFLLDLCIHLYEESTTLVYVQRGRFQRLMQYVDVLAYLRATAVDWDAFLAECQALQLCAPAYFALGNAHRLYDQAPLPRSVLQRVAASANVPEDFLDLYGADELPEPARWDTDLEQRLFDEALPAARPRPDTP